MKIFLLFLFIIICNYNSASCNEIPSIKKIVLSKFKDYKGNIVLDDNMPDWLNIDRRQIAIDDKDNIYVLDVRRNEILVYKHSRQDKSKIYLKPVKTIKFNMDEYEVLTLNDSFEVSSNGDRFYITSLYPFLLDYNGRKKAMSGFPYSELSRKCNNKYVTRYGRYLYDKNIKLLKKADKKILRYTDSNGNYFLSTRFDIFQYSPSGELIRQEAIDEGRGIIGIDGKDNIFLKTEAGAGGNGDWRILKIDKEWNRIGEIQIPENILFPIPFDDKDLDDLEYYASEEPFEYFKINCNGSIYLIHSFRQYPDRAFQRFLEGGEYYIYKLNFKQQ